MNEDHQIYPLHLMETGIISETSEQDQRNAVNIMGSSLAPTTAKKLANLCYLDS
jgi:hypothetical protein